MPTSEVVELQKDVAALFGRVQDLEAALAGGVAAGGGLESLAVSAGIRAKLGMAGLLTIEDVRACNENELMEKAGLRRTDARRVRKALKAIQE